MESNSTGYDREVTISPVVAFPIPLWLCSHDPPLLVRAPNSTILGFLLQAKRLARIRVAGERVRCQPRNGGCHLHDIFRQSLAQAFCPALRTRAKRFA